MKHDLLTEQLRNQLPKLGAVTEHDDAVAYTKFFASWTSSAWYPVEFDGVDTFWGLIENNDHNKLDHFTLTELEEKRGPDGSGIERDTQFQAASLTDLGKVRSTKLDLEQEEDLEPDLDL